MTLLLTMDLKSLVASYFAFNDSGEYVRLKKYEFLEFLRNTKIFNISYKIIDTLIAIKYDNI